MTIDDNMVGIGTTSPSQKLEVSGEGANAFIRVAYDDNYWLQLGPQTIQMELIWSFVVRVPSLFL